MGISEISSASSYEEWKLLNAQKEQAEEAASASDASRSRQIDSIKAAVSQEDISLSETTGSPIDTVEISSEGRAFLESSQAETAENAPASQTAAQETGESYTNLASLTNEEIEDLADDGIITQTEANTELAKRAAQEASENSSFADSKAAGIETVE